jgi:hypothetical protein
MLISSYSSFSILHFMDSCNMLLNSLSVCSVFVLVAYYEPVIDISEICD